MAMDETKVLRDALQEFFERTGVRIIDLHAEWAVECGGDAQVIEVEIRGRMP